MKLQNAYDTISDPDKRRAYDLRWPGIRDGLRAREESEKRQAEAAQADEKRAAEARARKQQEDRAREERVRNVLNLERSRSKHSNDIFELSREMRELAAYLKRLKEQDDEDARQEKRRNGLWAYLTSPIYGPAKGTDEQQRERENVRLQRRATKTIKESALAEKEARLRTLQDALQGVNSRIAAERNKAEEERAREEKEERARKLKTEQEATIRLMREKREMARRRREQAEQAAAERAREAQAAREAWEEQERARVAAAAEERRRREAEIRAESLRRAEEAAKKAKKNPNHRSGRATQSPCRHAGWWPKVEGRQLCGRCDTFQNRFLLQCPGCKMVACASCQKSLRGGGTWKSNHGAGRAGRRYDFGGNDGYERDDYHFNEYFPDYD